MLASLSVQRNSKDASDGLGAVLCYDPYFTRMLRGVKKAIADGNPVMIRLHPGARYQAPIDQVYRIDLESHSVLIVGYDDDQAAVAIADPGTGGQRWMSYQDLSLLIVNSTKSCTLIAAPLQVRCSAIEKDGLSLLSFRVGFYSPDSIVMDQDGQVITDVSLRVVSVVGCSLDQNQVRVSGSWKVGQFASLSLDLCSATANFAEIKVEVSANIRGERPYTYVDAISTEVTRRVSIQGARRSIAV